MIFVGMRAKHAVTCDEIVRDEISENTDETSKNADKALKNSGVIALLPVNNRNLYSTVAMVQQKSYKEALISTKGTK